MPFLPSKFIGFYKIFIERERAIRVLCYFPIDLSKSDFISRAHSYYIIDIIDIEMFISDNLNRTLNVSRFILMTLKRSKIIKSPKDRLIAKDSILFASIYSIIPVEILYCSIYQLSEIPTSAVQQIF